MEQTQPNKFLVPVAIIVAGALIALAIYSGGTKAPSNTASNNSEELMTLPAVNNGDHILGDAKAPIVIVEYSDTECPFCKVFHNTLKEIVNSYSGKVAWVYRQFPIPQLHSKAPKEAEATECAADLGGNQIFWKFLDQVFATTNSNDSLDPAELPKIANTVGLDVGQFNSCLSSGKYTSKVQSSIEEAIKIGARGTPYSVIVAKDGRQVVVNGAESIESVKAKIEALLK